MDGFLAVFFAQWCASTRAKKCLYRGPKMDPRQSPKIPVSHLVPWGTLQARAEHSITAQEKDRSKDLSAELKAGPGPF
jgi:hypothetical protein